MELFVKERLEKQCPTKISGLYYLYNKDREIIYVGISKNCVRQRLRTHLVTTPDFWGRLHLIIKTMIMRNETAFYSYQNLEPSLLKKEERKVIRLEAPKFNISHNSRFNMKVAQESNLSEQELLNIEMCLYNTDSVLELYKYKELDRIRQEELDDLYLNL